MTQSQHDFSGESSRSADRREFLKRTAAGVAAAGVAGLAGSWPAFAAEAQADAAKAATAPGATPETLVQQLYGTLTDEQKKLCAFEFEHPLRSRVDNNWFITKAEVGRNFNPDQQQLIREIFLKLHSEEYQESVMKQVEHDGGFRRCAIALFGQPGSGQFEFVLTGRHVTRRCDGDSLAGTAFGGPIFYGHAAAAFNEPATHPGNVYWFQAVRANELFQALDGKQREVALRSDPRAEQGTQTVQLAAPNSELRGLPVSELSADQKQLARQVMSDLLAPFRQADREESMKLIEKNGFDKLHFSYFKNLDIGNDGVWDVWQVEGPAMLWYFRGSPHVHTWVHIRESA